MTSGHASDTRPRPGETCGCCGTASRPPDIIDYIGQGLARRRRPPLPIHGDVHHDSEERRVRFTLAVADGVITGVGVDVSSCVTLIAYCERLVHIVTGLRVEQALAATSAAELIASLPQVPPYKHNLSELATTGLRSALRRAEKGATA